MITALGKDRLDPVLLPKSIAVTNELDVQAVLLGQRLGVLTDRIPQRLRELGEVKDPYLPAVEFPSERPSMADARQGSHDEKPIEARENTVKLACVAFGEHEGTRRLEAWIRSPPIPSLRSAPCQEPLWYRLCRVRVRLCRWCQLLSSQARSISVGGSYGCRDRFSNHAFRRPRLLPASGELDL